MRECFRLARRGAGHVSPNPLVGAVLVRHGRIVARGYHHAYGARHAEVDCLERYTGSLAGATLYVNLEPCSHYGQTPPCADYLIRKGIEQLVIGMVDPNPRVAGDGIRRMRRAGVSVRTGVLEADARSLNRFFVKHITTGLPYVHVKIAQTLDGRIAGGPSRWISSVASRRRAHQWRAEYDAVTVGAGTVRADNPSLTVRHVRGRDPDVVVLDGALRVPTDARIFRTAERRRVFVCTTEAALRRSAARARQLEKLGVQLLPFRGTRSVMDIREVVSTLYRQGIGSLLVEGGARVFAQFVYEGLVDELSVFIAPVVQGKGISAFDLGARAVAGRIGLRNLTATRIEKDLLVNALRAE